MTQSPGPLSGLRIVEVSSFVAAPLCGLTLSQLGAEVIRIDPIGGASDYNRWPVTDKGESIYWTGLNKGKRSLSVDMRAERGQELIRRLVTAPGPGGGILVTNAGGRKWMSHDSLAQLRSDVITLEILGRRDGSPGVDYTVNAALGFPQITGPADYAGVVNHALPAWDVACGLYAALSITAAVRQRDSTGHGSRDHAPTRRRRIGHRGNPRLPHRGTSERSQSRVRRKRRLRHVRNRFRLQRQRTVHDRCTHYPPFPRPCVGHRHHGGCRRCRSCTRSRLLRRRRIATVIERYSLLCSHIGSGNTAAPRSLQRWTHRRFCSRGTAVSRKW